MGETLVFHSSDFKSFAIALRKAAPELAKELRKELRQAGMEIVRDIKAEMPHQASASAAKRGVRFSDSLISGGAAIVIGGNKAPQSWAHAFTVGNAGPGRLKHPVWGKWSGSPATTMATPLVAERAWIKGSETARVRSGLALGKVIDQLSFGPGSS